MNVFLEQLIVSLWNRWKDRGQSPLSSAGDTVVGTRLVDGQFGGPVVMSGASRTQHAAIFGKTGFGKSFEIRNILEQDVRARRGFLLLDHHGDTVPYVLGVVAREERQRDEDLSSRLVLIDITETESSPGFNPLEASAERRFRQASDIAALLKRRFELDALGARTEELLRNTIHLLSDAQLTLVDAPLLLTNPGCMDAALRQATSEEVRSYFVDRFREMSEASQVAMREPVLNKLSAFIGDPRFRHVLGQQRSTFSLLDAMDRGHWVVVNLDIGRLGFEANTFAGLILAWLQGALFLRQSRTLFSVFADEVQNLLSQANALEALLAQSRKWGVGILTANQYLDQHSAGLRAALLSAASFMLFRLSAPDAEKFAAHLDGGKALAEILKNLPPRQMVVKTGNNRWQRAVVPTVAEPAIDTTDLRRRCQARWTRGRADIEAEIRARQQRLVPGKEALDDWD